LHAQVLLNTIIEMLATTQACTHLIAKKQVLTSTAGSTGLLLIKLPSLLLLLEISDVIQAAS